MTIVKILSPLLFLLSPISSAGECFCLVDENDNLRHSCVSQQQGIRKVFHCRGDVGNPISMEDLAGWQKLADGEGRCQPCKQRLNVEEGAIRGNGDERENVE